MTVIETAEALLLDLRTYAVHELMKEHAKQRGAECLYDEVFYDIEQLEKAIREEKNERKS